MKGASRITAIALLLAGLGSSQCSRSAPDQKGSQADRRYAKLFYEVSERIKKDYVESISPQEKYPAAFESMVGALDSTSAYLDREAKLRLLALQQGRSCLPGLYGCMDENRFRVISVREGSPAAAAGIGRGDSIEAVDERSLFSRSYWSSWLLLTPPSPCLITLRLKKKANAYATSLPLPVAQLPPRPRVSELAASTFLIRLQRLDPEIVQEIELRLGGKQKVRLLIDLTGSEWGDLESLQRLSRLLFPSEEGLVLKTRAGEERVPIGSPAPLDYQAVVMVDSSTRMYGELLASLLRKNGQRLIGEPTAGFLSHLQLFDLHDGSAILLTTGHYWLDGAQVGRKPIMPDIALSEAELPQHEALALRLLKETR